MAVLCAVTDAFAREKTVSRLVEDITGKDETRRHLGLLVLGELGRQKDLSGVYKLQVLTCRPPLRSSAVDDHGELLPILVRDVSIPERFGLFSVEFASVSSSVSIFFVCFARPRSVLQAHQ